MGRASSSKKVARAAKAAGQPGTSKSLLWPVSIGLVVLLGIGLIVVSAAGRDSSTRAAPILGDHWHASYGVYACGQFLPPLNDVQPDESGIHSHGDGLMHIHPFSTRYTGEDANIEAFGETTGLELSDDSISVANGGTWANGDDCDGEPGVVQVKVWSGLADEEGRLLESDFAEFAPQDGDLVTIAFLPDGEDIPLPESAGVQPTDVAPAPGDTVPEGVPSTIPTDEPGEGVPGEGEPGADETTDTSAADDTSETTATSPP